MAAADVMASVSVESDTTIKHEKHIDPGFITVGWPGCNLHIKSALAAEHLLAALWAARAALRAQEGTQRDDATDALVADPF